MAEEKVLVDNAADPDQVAKARQRQKTQREQELADLRAVLALVTGRRVIRRILDESCKTFESIFNSDPLWMARNSGKQDIGHFWMTEISAANPEALPLIMAGEPITTKEK